MLVAALAALLLQQTPGAVVWAPLPDPAVEEEQVPAAAPTLPDWALADPFAWERSQCSSLVRGDVSLGACQARVRTELAANLGDTLPAALRPTGLEEECLPTNNAANGFAVSCAPQRREQAAVSLPQERVCENRPQRTGNGVVSWAETCRPAGGAQGSEDGLKLRLFGRD